MDAGGERPVVSVVDGDPAERAFLEETIAKEGFAVRVFPSGREFLDAFDPGEPGCVVVDMNMPDLCGLEIQKRLEERGSRTPVLFISGGARVPDVVEAMKRGAADLLERPFDEGALLGSLRRAVEHDRDQRRARREVEAIRARLDRLTPRENEVLDLVVAGELNKTIARRLGIRERTVEAHRRSIMTKLEAESLAQLVTMVVTAREGAGGPDRE